MRIRSTTSGLVTTARPRLRSPRKRPLAHSRISRIIDSDSSDRGGTGRQALGQTACTHVLEKPQEKLRFRPPAISESAI